MTGLIAGYELTLPRIRDAFRRDLLEKYASVSKIGASEATTQTFFTNLTTVGPQVTLESKGHLALAWISCRAWNSTAAANQCLMGVSVTDDDGEVIPPSLTAALIAAGSTTQANARARGILIPLNIAPGTYTYTAQYRSGVAATSANFDQRVLVVFAP